MSGFVITPTNIDYFENILRDPISGRLTIPFLTFNTNYLNPFYSDLDPLNEDPSYHKSVIDHFYLRLKEKWLYKEPIFRSLLKYFKVEKDGDEGKVSLISDPDKAAENKDNEQYRKYILKYIEKYFITKHLISKILKEYVATTHIKWYDLFHNTSTLKDLFAHKLKKLIISTIYQVQGEGDKFKIDKKSQSRINETYDFEPDETSD